MNSLEGTENGSMYRKWQNDLFDPHKGVTTSTTDRIKRSPLLQAGVRRQITYEEK